MIVRLRNVLTLWIVLTWNTVTNSRVHNPVVVIKALTTKDTSRNSYDVFIQGPNGHNISITGDNFTVDGNPFLILSGSLHYFRVPHEYWSDRLRKLKQAGLNSVATYVEWSFHEPEERKYIFEADRDIAEFVKLAAEEGLYVLLRVGPYICAERDLGGLPYWLLGKYPKIKLRTTDKDFLNETKIWVDKLFTYVKPLLFGNGGPIILVQIENEYGSYDSDLTYKLKMRDIISENVESKALLYTTDGSSNSLVKAGAIPGVLPTIDFGSSSNITEIVKQYRTMYPHGPIMNSEYYPGWLTHWGESIQHVGTEYVVKTLNDMLKSNMNLNFYVFFGGTNFEFSSGANFQSWYQPDITSYDYDAPLNEAGDPTPKYFAIRKALLKFQNKSELLYMAVPSPSPKGNYGRVNVTKQMNLMSPSGRQTLGKQYNDSYMGKYLPTFEALRQRAGLILYETVLTNDYENILLNVTKPRDWINVYIDGVFKGVIRRMFSETGFMISAKSGSTLSLLVENQGRINFGSRIHDFKGILSCVKMKNQSLNGPWRITGYPLTEISSDLTQPQDESEVVPTLYEGFFTFPEGVEPLDTFLDTSGWGKGYVWVNGHNLGRYWPLQGPQVTLYVPGVWLHPAPQPNNVQILEMLIPSRDLKVEFIDYPILNATKLTYRRSVGKPRLSHSLS